MKSEEFYVEGKNLDVWAVISRVYGHDASRIPWYPTRPRHIDESIHEPSHVDHAQAFHLSVRAGKEVALCKAQSVSLH